MGANLLVGCDDVPSAELARARLDQLSGDWTVASRRPALSPWLLVDHGNPFVKAPIECTIEANGQLEPWVLRWTVAPVTTVRAALTPYNRIAQDHRQRLDFALADDGAAWITVGNLTDQERHAQLLDSVTRAAAAIQKAPYLVWDLRGNGGGNSTLGDALAEAVWGKGSLLAAKPRRHPKRWRASARLAEFIQRTYPEHAAMILPSMEAALRRGEPLFTLPGESDLNERAAPTRSPLETGPVFVLTDAGCFSSCIQFRNLLVAMGSVQVGDPTGRHEVYGESWFRQALPSQLGELLLPIAIFGDSPRSAAGRRPSCPGQAPPATKLASGGSSPAPPA